MMDDFTKLKKAIFKEIDAYMASALFVKQPERKGNFCWDNLRDYLKGDLWATVICTADHLRYSFYLLDGEKEIYIFQSARSTDDKPRDIAREVAYIAEAIDRTRLLHGRS